MDANSAGLIWGVDGGTVVGAGTTVVEEGGRLSVVEGGRLSVVDGGSVTVADATLPAVVEGAIIMKAPAVVVLMPAVVIVVLGLAVVGVGLAVVVVGLGLGLTVVVVAALWQPGRPWPAGGLHVLPGWAVTGPAKAQAVIPIVVATANVIPNPKSHERKDPFLILKPLLSHTAAPFLWDRPIPLSGTVLISVTNLIRSIMYSGNGQKVAICSGNKKRKRPGC